MTSGIVKPRKARAAHYSSDVNDAMAFCWAVLGAPTLKRLAPIVDELVSPSLLGSW